MTFEQGERPRRQASRQLELLEQRPKGRGFPEGSEGVVGTDVGGGGVT